MATLKRPEVNDLITGMIGLKSTNDIKGVCVLVSASL